MKKVKIKINKPLKNYKVGDIINIEVDANSIPTDIYWRRRLKDAEIDNCIEFFKESKPKKKSRGDEQ